MKMKYYSRSPQELQEHINKANCNTEKSGRRGRIILFLNLLVILMVFGIAQVHLNREKAVKSVTSGSRTFQWENWNISTSCSTRQGCDLVFTPGAKAKMIGQIEWRAQENSDVTASGIFNPSRNKESVFHIPPVFSAQQKVHLEIQDQYNKPVLNIRAYP